MVEEAISEHHLISFPQVDLLAKQSAELKMSLVLDQFGVEEALRDLDVVLVLDELAKASVGLSRGMRSVGEGRRRLVLRAAEP